MTNQTQQKTVVTPSMQGQPLHLQVLAYVQQSPGATYQELAVNFQASIRSVRHAVKQLRAQRLVRCKVVNQRTQITAAHPAVWEACDADPLTIHAADLFCGAGGFSQGMAQALETLGRSMDAHVDLVGINHDEEAMKAWQANHPFGRPCREDIAKAQPRKLFPGGRVRLLLASPSCTHFSTARGGLPVSDQLRSHAWMVVRWARDLDIDTIIVENVPEIRGWGPTRIEDCKCLAKGPALPTCKNCKGGGRVEVAIKDGSIFRKWIRELKLLGYTINYDDDGLPGAILNAADHGDATSRRRFFLIAVKGAGPAPVPKQSHSKVNPKTGQPSVPGTKPWRAAREIINWDEPSKSIFDRQKPLAKKTLRRMFDGLERRNGDWIKPFMVLLRNNCGLVSIDGPVPTITAGGTHIGLCEPIILGQQSGAVGRSVSEPINTVAAGGAISLAEPVVLRSGGPEGGTAGVSEPLPAHLTREHQALAEPVLMHVTHGARSHDIAAPVPTITTAQRGELALAEPSLSKVSPDGFVMGSGGPTGQMVPRSPDLPLPTVIGNTRLGVAQATLQPVVMPPDGPGGNGEYNHAQPIDAPLSTIRASRGDRIGLAEPILTQYNGTGGAPSVDDPLPTATAKDRFGLAEPCIVDMLGSKDNWQARNKGINEPLPSNHAGAVRTGLAEAKLEPVVLTIDRPENNRSLAHGVDQPIATVVANNIRIGVATPELKPESVIVPNFGERDGQAPRHHALGDPLPAVTSHGAGVLTQPVLSPEAALQWHNGRPVVDGWMLDIKFRMLTPRELAASMSFPPTFKFAKTKKHAIKQIGNAVAVRMAEALVLAVMQPANGVNLYSFPAEVPA